MAQFVYAAANQDGAILQGEIEAASEGSARRLLEKRGLRPTRITAKESMERKRVFGRRRKLKPVDLAVAMHELATMLLSGMPLAEAVEAQATDAEHPELRVAFRLIGARLASGSPFSVALEDARLPLPSYVSRLAFAGEQAGVLGEALRDAAKQLDHELAVRREAAQALTYPAILTAVGIGAVIVMFTFVVPKFAFLLERGDDLPWISWAVLAGGAWLNDNALLVAFVIAAIGAGVYTWTQKSGNLARLDGLLDGLPLVGAWRRESDTARWARMMSTLTHHRVPLLSAMAIAREVVSSNQRRTRLLEVEKSVRAGVPLAKSLEDQDALKSSGYNLIRVGERSGNLSTMLASLATLCEDAGRVRTKQILTVLEPAAIMVMGLVVGVVMLGIVLGITSANDLVI